MLFEYDVGVELRHLRYFAAVAELRNVTQAAGRLRVAQPALSRQIQDLEEELGVKLLERSTRGIKLTEAGKFFANEAGAVLARADQALKAVRALARGETGELRVGYAPSPTTEILPRALAAFQKAAPGVRVTLLDLYARDTALPHQRSHRCGGSGRVACLDSGFERFVRFEMNSKAGQASTPKVQSKTAFSTNLHITNIAPKPILQVASG